MSQYRPATEGRGRAAVPVRRAVKALVTAGRRALLVRERHADGTPFWTLPGGGIVPGESPRVALERELAEELCCRCVVGDRVDVFWYGHVTRHAVSRYTVRACRLLSEPEPARSEGVEALRWVGPDSAPTATLPQVQAVAERALASRADERTDERTVV